jgi:hypothetical protein
MHVVSRFAFYSDERNQVRISAREIEDSQKMRLLMVLKPNDKDLNIDGSVVQDLIKNEHTELIEFRHVENQLQKVRCLHHCTAVIGPISGELLKIEMLINNFEPEAFSSR